MAGAPFWMWPWIFTAQVLRMPLSGNLGDIAPVTTWFPVNIDVDLPGDPKVEAEVFRKVATTGKQLGRISDAVLALAVAVGQTGLKEIEALEEIAGRVEEIKSRRRSSLAAAAVETLTRLRSEDEEGYRAVLQELSLAPSGSLPRS